MNYFKTIYSILSVVAILQLQSCSAESENLLQEETLILEDTSVNNLTAKVSDLVSHGLRATSKRSSALSDNVSALKRYGARDIATLNRNRIAVCNRVTNTNTYFKGSAADQKNNVPYYYSVDPSNKSKANIVLTMCRRGQTVVARTFVLAQYTVGPRGIL